MIKRIAFGVFFLILGGSLIYFSGSLYKIFGRWPWAEKYLGGTIQGYIIIGFLVMVLGFLFLFGVIDTKANI